MPSKAWLSGRAAGACIEAKQSEVLWRMGARKAEPEARVAELRGNLLEAWVWLSSSSSRLPALYAGRLPSGHWGAEDV